MYKKYHTKGPKRNFDFRYDSQVRALNNGFDKAGIGTLLGLNTKNNDNEIIELIKHAHEIEKETGKIPYSLSIPRHQEAKGIDFNTPNPVSDNDYIFYHALLRIALPNTKIVITSRENEAMMKKLEVFSNIRDLSPRPGVGGNISEGKYIAQNKVKDERSAQEIIDDLKLRKKRLKN